MNTVYSPTSNSTTKARNNRKYKRNNLNIKDVSLFYYGHRTPENKKNVYTNLLKYDFSSLNGQRLVKTKKTLSQLMLTKIIKVSKYILNIEEKVFNYIIDETIIPFFKSIYLTSKFFLDYKLKQLNRKIFKIIMKLDAKNEELKRKKAEDILKNGGKRLATESVFSFSSITSMFRKGKREAKSKSYIKWLYLPASCIALTFTMLLTCGAYFKKGFKNNIVKSENEYSYSAKPLSDFRSAAMDEKESKISKAIEESSEIAPLETEKSETQDGIEILSLEDNAEVVAETKKTTEALNEETYSSVAQVSYSAKISLSDTSSNSNLVYFNPNEFYRCPNDVSTEELLAIFGITPDQFYNKIYGIVCAESVANINGYNEVYACFYTLLNRISADTWVRSHGTSIYKQATAYNQYVVFQDGTYTSYKKYTEEQKEIALIAMRDAMYNFIVDPTHAPHTWVNFRSNGTTTFSKNMFTPGGNRYKTENPYKTVYPAFLQSDAAVAMRNKALGIVESNNETLESSVSEYSAEGEVYSETGIDVTLNPELDQSLTPIPTESDVLARRRTLN